MRGRGALGQIQALSTEEVRGTEAAVVAFALAAIVRSPLKRGTAEAGNRISRRCDTGDEGDATEGDIVARDRSMNFVVP
jgi:hypothetical protein